MKSCPKCRKHGRKSAVPGPGTRTRHVVTDVGWLDLAGQGLDRTKTAAAIQTCRKRGWRTKC
eukprot:1072545-Prymnesium_polylepis.1